MRHLVNTSQGRLWRTLSPRGRAAADHADAPVPHVAAKDTLQKRIPERTQIVSAPVPQILEEPVAPVSQFQEETVGVIRLSP